MRRKPLIPLLTSLLIVGCGDPSGVAPSGSGGAGSGGSGGSGGGNANYPECFAPDSADATLTEAKQIIDETLAARKSVWKSIFGLADDGTIDPGGLDTIDWDPSHDSVHFTSLDVERNVPLFISNDAAKIPSSAHVTLGIAADTGMVKYALLGANAPSDLAKNPPAPGSDAAKMETFTLRLIQWLTGKDPGDGTGMKIVLAQLADTYWFDHDKGTAKFFADKLPMASVNAEDTCESAALAGCLDGASLLVISGEDGADDENHAVAADPDAVMAAVDSAMAKGIPVLYLQYDGSLTPLAERLMKRFRVSTSDNYWEQERLAGFSPNSLLSATDELDALRNLVGTLDAKSLAVSDYQECLGQASQYDDCEAPGFMDKIGRGTAALRATMNGLDRSGTNPFDTDGFRLVRALERLGQTYRSTDAVKYPVNFESDPMAFARAMFADTSVHYVQRCSLPQSDLGTFVCARTDVLAGTCTPYDAAQVARDNGTATEAFRAGEEWTSTGFYALPGAAFTVKRTDSALGRVSIRLNFHRGGTSRSMQSDGGTSRYDRPGYLASPWISLEPSQELTLTSPYGGPIYVKLDGNAELAGQKATLDFTGVAKHAALLDIGNAAAVSSFVDDVGKNPLPHVDLRGDGFEVHLRKDKLLAGVSAPYELVSRADGTGVMVDYKGDVGLLLADFRDNFVAPEYRLAGFAPPGSTLDQALSADVKVICNALGWSCTDSSIHSRTTIQHANYDEYANCGNGCSGNPFDADWFVTPLGWGESHELGHNLQMGLLNIGYVTAGNRNDWSQYQSRAGENSNNIFPYHNLWRWLRSVKGEAGTVVDGHMNLKTLFAMVQSSRAGLVRQINGQSRKVVFDEACNVVGDYPSNAADVHAEAIWENGGYAATNGPRMGFYLQLPLRLQGKTMSTGTTLTNGFDIFTLLYAEARLLRKSGVDDVAWDAAKNNLGFGLFPRTGHATYGGRDVRDMPGNDFLLVSLSFLSGLDFRPYFNDLGVRFTDLAASQVEAFIAAGKVNGPIGSALAVLDEDLPDADISKVATVPPDGVATWPRDGFHPKNCP